MMTKRVTKKDIDKLTPAQLAEAKDRLRRYFEIGWKITTRLQKENPEQFEAAVQKAREFDLLEAKKLKNSRMRKPQYPSSEGSST